MGRETTDRDNYLVLQRSQKTGKANFANVGFSAIWSHTAIRIRAPALQVNAAPLVNLNYWGANAPPLASGV